MTAPVPPYALPAVTFPFPALAALAGRAALGGEREVALACFMAARLAAGASTAPLDASARADRAAAARGWFASLALPAATRIPLARLVDATAGDDRQRLAATLATVRDAAARWLDHPARAELDELLRAVAP